MFHKIIKQIGGIALSNKLLKLNQHLELMKKQQNQTFSQYLNDNKQPYSLEISSLKLNNLDTSLILQKYDNQKRFAHQFHEQAIFQKINKLDQQTKKLLQISRKISNTSVMSKNNNVYNSMQYENVPTIFYNVQNELKNSFNQLIVSIQQFYVDIHSKLKEITNYYTSTSVSDSLSSSSIKTFKNPQRPSNQNKHHSNGQNLYKIMERVNLLQKDLQETKSNEKKLMDVIQRLVQKYSLTHETTIIKEDPFVYQKLSQIRELEYPRKSDIYNAEHQNPSKAVYLTSPLKFRNLTFSKAATVSINNPEQISAIKHVKSLQKLGNYQTKINHETSICQSRFNSNPNDYSECQQLTKVQVSEPTQTPSNHKTFLSFNQQKNFLRLCKSNSKYQCDINTKEYLPTKNSNELYQSSTRNQDDNSCYIRKIYSKQNKSVGKVSLKNENTALRSIKKSDNINSANKAHRETYLMKNLLN